MAGELNPAILPAPSPPPSPPRPAESLASFIVISTKYSVYSERKQHFTMDQGVLHFNYILTFETYYI